MAEFKELFAYIVDILKHPDVVVLGAMFMMWAIGFVSGCTVCELMRVKHEIKIRRLHHRRRDGW